MNLYDQLKQMLEETQAEAPSKHPVLRWGHPDGPTIIVLWHDSLAWVDSIDDVVAWAEAQR